LRALTNGLAISTSPIPSSKNMQAALDDSSPFTLPKYQAL
jgi:hypothetical protein